MRFLSRGILLEILIICLVYLKEYLPFTNSLAILSLILIAYGLFSIVSYCFKSETDDGESKISYLLFGCFYFIGGVILISFASSILAFDKYIFSCIIIIHGLSRIFVKGYKGIVIKVLNIIWGIMLIIFGIYYTNLIISIDVINGIINSFYFGICLIVIDILLLILYCVLPRNDLENKNVKIGYSSFEDQVEFKKEHTSNHEFEVIDLDKLFNKDKENKNEEM